LNNFFMRQYRTSHVVDKAISKIYAYIPTEVADGSIQRDEFTDAPKDINVTGVDEHGWDTTWKRSVLYGRVSWIDPASVAMYGGLVAGGKTGDLSIGGKRHDIRTYQAVENDDRAYLLVDGDDNDIKKRVRPISIMPNRVLGPTSLEIRCEVVRDE